MSLFKSFANSFSASVRKHTVKIDMTDKERALAKDASVTSAVCIGTAAVSLAMTKVVVGIPVLVMYYKAVAITTALVGVVAGTTALVCVGRGYVRGKRRGVGVNASVVPSREITVL